MSSLSDILRGIGQWSRGELETNDPNDLPHRVAQKIVAPFNKLNEKMGISPEYKMDPDEFLRLGTAMALSSAGTPFMGAKQARHEALVKVLRGTPPEAVARPATDEALARSLTRLAEERRAAGALPSQTPMARQVLEQLEAGDLAPKGVPPAAREMLNTLSAEQVYPEFAPETAKLSERSLGWALQSENLVPPAWVPGRFGPEGPGFELSRMGQALRARPVVRELASKMEFSHPLRVFGEHGGTYPVEQK